VTPATPEHVTLPSATLLVGVGQGRFDATGEVLDRLGELGDRSSAHTHSPLTSPPQSRATSS
jgi:hypothetical protein